MSVFGYYCDQQPIEVTRDLYFHGLEFVFWDQPSNANTLTEPKFKQLLRFLRRGDFVVFSNASDLGTRKTSQECAFAHLEAKGIRAIVLTGTLRET